MKFYSKFKIRVVYKSGYVHDLWVWKFNTTSVGDKLKDLSWTLCDPVHNRPIELSNDISNIESIWQIGHKQVFRFSDPVK